MKKTIYILYSIFFILFSSCDSDDDNNCQGIDCLPPITQTGAGTFGCLVNGEPFVDNSGNFNCFYQLVDGEYYFGISPNDNVNGFNGLGVGADMLELNEGLFEFNTPNNRNAYLIAFCEGNDNAIEVLNSESNSGSLSIEFFNLSQQIISATFEGTLVKDDGTLITITEGRFDSFFTR